MNTYPLYLEALLNGNRAACASIVQALLADNIALEDLYLNWFQRAMYEVGELWEHNLISVATEHLASAITESLMHLTYPQLFNRPHLDKRVLISCVPNEYHQIGSHMVADIFELYGWHAYSLGANTPSKDLIRGIQRQSPDVIGFSMGVLFNLPYLQQVLDAVHQHNPTANILLGGRAFASELGQLELVTLQAGYPNVTYLNSLTALKAFIHAQ